MSKQVRWGILGAGHIADKFISDMRAVESAMPVAIVSSTPEKAFQLSSKYNIELIFSDYETFAKSDEFEAVYIATAHNFHFEHARLCLEHGKHVLCEKPVTVNVNELLVLQKLAGQKGLLFMEAMWSYFLPTFGKAKEWINNGLIGEIQQIHAQFGFKAPYLPEKRIFNINLAGGALLDVGIYPIAFALFFVDSPFNQMYSQMHIGKTGVDEHNSLILHFENGAMAILSSSVTFEMDNRAYIYGSKGRIMLPEFWRSKKVILEAADQQIIFEDKRPTWGYNYEIEHFNELIMHGKTESPVVSKQVSLKNMEIMDKIRRENNLIYPFENQ